MGNATNNVSYETFKKYSELPEVEWSIPISLGDSYRGFRVVSTNENYYKHYRFRKDHFIEFSEGVAPSGIFDVALGSDVAKALGHKLGDNIVLTHGVMEDGVSLQNHADKPFRLVGILNKTGTPVDKSVYITLEGMEAIHIDWGDGAPPMPGQEVRAETMTKEMLPVKQITTFLLRFKSFPAILTLQRQINTDETEPLSAIIPGVALDELWRTIGYAEDGLRIVSACVVLVGLLGMLITLLSSVNERRREMAILRAVGAHPRSLVGLLTFEAWLLGTLGALTGAGFMYVAFAIARPLLDKQFGLLLPFQILSGLEWSYLATVSVLAAGIGLAPALAAYRNSLVDGLTPRV